MLIEYKLPIITKQADGSYLGKGGMPLEDAVELCKRLEEKGVDMIHVAQANHTGNMNDTIPAMGTRDYGFMLQECKAIKKAVKIPLSIVGRVVTAGAGEALLATGVCDMIGYGRSLLTEPDFANKLAAGEGHLIRECIMCNKGCTDAIQNRRFLSCILNAENGYEADRKITKAQHTYNVAVVGAGVAGLEAARVLKIKGHNVEVFEKSLRVGGQVNIASVPPRKGEMLRILNYYENELKHLGVEIRLNSEFTPDMADKYDYVIVATGAENAKPGIKGIDNENVVSSWDVLAGKEVVFGKIVVCGGGLVGTETAEYLAEKGNEVEIIEMQDAIAKEESNTILPVIMKSFKERNVKINVLSRIKEITLNGVLVDKLDKEGNVVGEEMINGDFIVTALTSRKTPLVIENSKAKVIYVGDCVEKEACTIDHAIKSAYLAANEIN